MLVVRKTQNVIVRCAFVIIFASETRTTGHLSLKKEFINNLKTYDYENDAINPDDSCSFREHRDGNQFEDYSKEVPQGHSEIPYRDQSSIPPLC